MTTERIVVPQKALIEYNRVRAQRDRAIALLELERERTAVYLEIIETFRDSNQADQQRHRLRGALETADLSQLTKAPGEQ